MRDAFIFIDDYNNLDHLGHFRLTTSDQMVGPNIECSNGKKQHHNFELQVR